MNPILKWAGGKRWLLPRISKIFKDFESSRFVEPFAGGIAVSLGLMPERALLNDVNPHLINFYRWIKTRLSFDGIILENDPETYYSNRKRFNELIKSGKSDNSEAASLFYYLNKTGYNGLCRFNKDGYFNVPFGTHKKINYEKNFTEYEGIFKGWEFSCADFERISVKADDFIYADPPYDVEFTQYSGNGFDWKDQVRLVEWLDGFGNPIVLSNQRTDRIVNLYIEHGYEINLIEAPRKISCNGDRKPAVEVIATKNLYWSKSTV